MKDFDQVAQDKNAGNPGDWVKAPIADALRGLLEASDLEVEVIDAHAGAGCYAPTEKHGIQDVFADDWYTDKMAACLPILAKALAIEGTAPSHVGVGPMLCHLADMRLRKYLGFDLAPDACSRLRLTMQLLGLKHAEIRGGGADGDSRAHLPAYLSTHAHAPDRLRVLILDPMHWQSDKDLKVARRLIHMVSGTAQPALVGVFNPGTAVHRGARLQWKRAWDDFAGTVAGLESWDLAEFTLLKTQGATKKDGDGRLQHYGLILLSNQLEAIEAARTAWATRKQNEEFAAWTSV